MNNCKHCKYADWQVTKVGALHPSGDGRCTFKYEVPQLPASMCWIGRNPPAPSGGHINRREKLSKHCPYWASNRNAATPKKPEAE